MGIAKTANTGKRSQVLFASCRAPEERMVLVILRVDECADDLIGVVDRPCLASGSLAKIKLLHPVLSSPDEGVPYRPVRTRRCADHMPGGVDSSGPTEGAAERSQIQHPSGLGPKKGMVDIIAVEFPNDFGVAVDRICQAVTAQASQILHARIARSLLRSRRVFQLHLHYEAAQQHIRSALRRHELLLGGLS